jgi:hypothetical protein
MSSLAEVEKKLTSKGCAETWGSTDLYNSSGCPELKNEKKNLQTFLNTFSEDELGKINKKENEKTGDIGLMGQLLKPENYKEDENAMKQQINSAFQMPGQMFGTTLNKVLLNDFINRWKDDTADGQKVKIIQLSRQLLSQRGGKRRRRTKRRRSSKKRRKTTKRRR